MFELELKMLRHFIERDLTSPFTQKILATISKVEDYLIKYTTIIEDIKKGYVIHKKQVVLNSGKTILFSLKINNEWETKGKRLKNLTNTEKKELKEKIERVLISVTL